MLYTTPRNSPFHPPPSPFEKMPSPPPELQPAVMTPDQSHAAEGVMQGMRHLRSLFASAPVRWIEDTDGQVIVYTDNAHYGQQLKDFLMGMEGGTGPSFYRPVEPPRDPKVEALAQAVLDGETVIPKRAKWLTVDRDGRYRWWFGKAPEPHGIDRRWVGDRWRDWLEHEDGTPPTISTWDGVCIDLTAVRKRVAELAGGGE